MRGLTEIEQHRQERDDVLAAFASTVPLPDARILREWLGRYPEHAHDLVDLAVSLIEEAQQLPETVPIEEDDFGASDEDELVVGAMPVIRALLSRSEASGAWESSPLNTDDTAPATAASPQPAKKKRAELTIQEVAEAAMLSTHMVSLLLRHYIHYHSIPTEAIERLAQAMQMRPDTLKDYLSHRRISQPNRFGSERRALTQRIPIRMIGLPTDMHLLVPEAFLVDFRAAIDADQSMPADRRDIWLALSE